MIARTAADLKRVGDALEAGGWMLTQMRGETHPRRIERGCAARRQDDELRAVVRGRLRAGCGDRRLLEEHMNVGSADSERAHTGAPRRARLGPGSQCRI